MAMPAASPCRSRGALLSTGGKARRYALFLQCTLRCVNTSSEVGPASDACANSDALRKLADALGSAVRPQLWLFFPPNPHGFPGTAFACGSVDRSPSSETRESLGVAIKAVVDDTSAESLILGIEREGRGDPGRIDGEWIGTAIDLADDVGVRVVGVLISHSSGVRSLNAAELASYRNRV